MVTKRKKSAKRNKNRMNFCLDPEIKRRVARAAAIMEQKLTDFAVSALSEKAEEIIYRHESLLLTSKDYEYFLSVLDEDRELSERSRLAARRYQRGRREGVRHHLAD